MTSYPIGSPPCGQCRICCIAEAVRLLPEDDASQYSTEPNPYFKGELMLAHKPGGECIYSTERGCAIYERRPTQCREMDCRIFSAIHYSHAKKMALTDLTVWRKGRSLNKEYPL